MVRYQTVNAAALVFELTHCLFECATLFAHQVCFWYAHIGVEHFAKVAVGGHVLNFACFNAGRIHGHNNFADACVWWPIVAGATNEIAVLRNCTE